MIIVLVSCEVFFPSVWPAGILGPLQLNLEAFHSNLESIHGLDGCLGAGRIVETDESCWIRTILVNTTLQSMTVLNSVSKFFSSAMRLGPSNRSNDTSQPICDFQVISRRPFSVASKGYPNN